MSDLFGSPDDSIGQMPLALDPCCGSRMMWFDHSHRDVVFGDKRRETLTLTDRSQKEDGTRTLVVEPDAMMDFRALPYKDETFYLVAFDPPHLIWAGPRSWLAAKYGKLGKDWRDDLKRGLLNVSVCCVLTEPWCSSGTKHRSRCVRCWNAHRTRHCLGTRRERKTEPTG